MLLKVPHGNGGISDKEKLLNDDKCSSTVSCKLIYENSNIAIRDFEQSRTFHVLSHTRAGLDDCTVVKFIISYTQLIQLDWWRSQPLGSVIFIYIHTHINMYIWMSVCLRTMSYLMSKSQYSRINIRGRANCYGRSTTLSITLTQRDSINFVSERQTGQVVWWLPVDS